MTNMVTIGGASVDAEDPCALYQALYAAKLKMIAGDHVEEIEVQSPSTRRRLKVSSGNMKAIDAELMSLSASCAAKNGNATRLRYAKCVRFT